MINFGLIGKMGSGKNSAANVLIHTHGYVSLSFAAPLKEMVIEADPLIGYRTAGPYQNVSLHLSDILSGGMSFEDAKRKFPEVRRSLQRIGQGIRKLDPDYWVRLADDAIEDVWRSPIVFTDVRYPNEADMLRSRGYTLVRITRPSAAGGLTMAETREALHDSETALDGYAADVEIRNDADLISLTMGVLTLVNAA